MGYRYYDTRIGRFITQDPIHSGDNWYAYAGNNPVNATDPSGLSIINQGAAPSPSDSRFGNDPGGLFGGSGMLDDFFAAENASSERGQLEYSLDELAKALAKLDAAPADANAISTDGPSSEGALGGNLDSRQVTQQSSVTTPQGVEVLGEISEDGVTVGKPGNPGKEAARQLLKELNVSEEQFASANRAISRATASSKIAIKRELENIIVSVSRNGRNGYQITQHTIDQYGNKQVLQQAYDALGNLVHFHPK